MNSRLSIIFYLLLILCSLKVNANTVIDIPSPRSDRTKLPKCTTTNYESSQYINFLEKKSMLYQASELAKTISGNGVQWRHSYSEPQHEKVIEKASVWFDAYPASIIGKKTSNTLQTLGDKDLWNIFRQIGIKAIHTGPMETAGGIVKGDFTTTVDGGFDPIMYGIDPKYGTDAEFKKMTETAAEYGGIIISDVVPGHTGKGPDFRLAERNYKDYPGIYDIISINEKDWNLLPKFDNQWETVGIDKKTVDALCQKGYLPGRLQNVRFKPKGYEEVVTGWDATAPIKGVDGIERRWVFLHYYRPGQPTMNWLDPSFAAQRIITGGITNAFKVLGAKMVRLDANAYLGIEPVVKSDTTWSNATPLAILASNYLAMYARKIGGWTYEEVGLPLNEMKKFMKLGPDISIDFITRGGLIHSAYTGNAGLLKLTLREMLKAGIDPKRLMHSLQSHDNFGYSFSDLSKYFDRKYKYNNEMLSGKKIEALVQVDMKKVMPYVKGSGSSICTTYVGLFASRMQIEDIYNMTPQEKEKILKGMILVTLYSAMQPGIIDISGWDLVGALPVSVDNKSIEKYIKQGDYRWLNRGAYDLMGYDIEAKESSEGIPKPPALFGSLPEQLKDSNSYVSHLKYILTVREKYKIPLSKMVLVPETDNNGVVVMVNLLPDKSTYQITALNFGDKTVIEKINLGDLNINGNKVQNLMSGANENDVTEKGILNISIDPWAGKILIISR
jgi:trehalose synthase